MSRLPLLYEAQSFSLENAATMARASKLVYADPGVIETTLLRQWRFQRFHFFDVSGTQAFVAADDDALLVCFRGTESDQLEDWITDANAKLVDGPLDGQVHAGFYDALSHVWQDIDRNVRRLDEGGSKSLWLTGHSLGAALATLAAARWIDQGRPVQGVYTFGQPRTGDQQFARNYNFAIKPSAFRFVNNNDLVTRIPPRAFGYSHLGTFKYFTDDGELVDDINWWNRFLDSWKVVVEDVFDWANDGIRDHSMNGYCELIERELRRNGSRNVESGLLRFLQRAKQHIGSLARPRRAA